jgi:hypothetical protein
MSAKVRKPKLYNLFWYASEIERRRAVALNHINVMDERPGVPAVILYPAFATPGVHVRGENDDMFELLLVTPSSVKVTPEVVNQYLKVSSKLDPEKKAPFRPLFEAAEDLGKLIEVAPAKPENGIIGTHSVFHGVLSRHSALHHLFVTPEAAKKVFQANDPLRRLGALGEAVAKLVGKPVDKRPEEEILADCYAFHKVRVHASCLEKAPLRPGEPGATVREIQDDVVRALLEQMNGKDLRGKSKGNWAEAAHGPGMHCFPVTGTKVDLARVQEDQPIVSYHPLFVYDELGYANIGHVADVHLNARQQVLRRSPARVIEAPGAQSPEVGKLINVYSENLLSILMQLKQKPMDVLLVGGDIVDHARNAYPFQNQGALREPSAADVWKMVDLGDGYEDRYQAFADHITFYSILKSFYDEDGRPAFVVSGNHDAYQDAYGISPRVLGIRANEGVPADHNMTFYEAMLAFGRSYGKVKNKSNFTPEMYRWFYSVFTPFSDFAVSLPRQRIVGLAWGDDEKLIDFPPGAQGFGHLPRANESASEVQLRVVRKGLSSAKKMVLFSHFTFVSYDDDLPNLPNSKKENERVILSKTYTKQDLGTFQIARDQLYPIVADPNQVQCVLSGHSHRKGVYFLGARQGGAYETEMRPLFNPVEVGAFPGANRVPIIVSDSAGPLPRLNFKDEFLKWGSDRPSGTFVQSASDGGVARIEAVRCLLPGSRPRLAVAMEYLHPTFRTSRT